MTDVTKWTRLAFEKQAGDEWWFGGGNGMQVVLFPEGEPEYNSFAVLDGEDEDKAERLAACWNALATIPDPQAFMEAARGMRDLCLELIQRSGFTYKARNGRDCHIEDESGERCVLVPHEVWAQIEASLAAFDAALGEQ